MPTLGDTPRSPLRGPLPGGPRQRCDHPCRAASDYPVYRGRHDLCRAFRRLSAAGFHCGRSMAQVRGVRGDFILQSGAFDGLGGHGSTSTGPRYLAGPHASATGLPSNPTSGKFSVANLRRRDRHPAAKRTCRVESAPLKASRAGSHWRRDTVQLGGAAGSKGGALDGLQRPLRGDD